MAVRRLDPRQSASFAFSPENLAWAETIIARYPPGKQAAAVIPILWRAQEQNGGWTPEPAVRTVAGMLGMAYIRVYEIATFYTMFQLSPVGKKAHLQVCGTTPCMLRGAEGLIEVCKRRIAGEPHTLSEKGEFSWEEVECLGACANAPIVQIGRNVYEDLTAETLRRLLDSLSRGKPVKAGSQIGRRASCPEGGATSLQDPALYNGSLVGGWQARLAGKPQRATEVAAAAATPAPPSATSAEAPPDAKPAMMEGPRGGKADDLKLLGGVDGEVEAILNRLGIFHFDQIANWSETNLRWLDQHLVHSEGPAERRGWVEQAKKLAAGRRPADGAGGRGT